MLALEVLCLKRLKVDGLISTFTLPHMRVTMHGVRHIWIQVQARSLNLPLYPMYTGERATNEDYEKSFFTLIRILKKKLNLEFLAFGDIFLEDIRRYREKLVKQAGITALFPIWGYRTDKLSHYFIKRGYRAWITAVDRTRLGIHWLGKEYRELIEHGLPADCDPCGENGEFHTYVFDGPLFSGKINVKPTGNPVHGEFYSFIELSAVR